MPGSSTVPVPTNCQQVKSCPSVNASIQMARRRRNRNSNMFFWGSTKRTLVYLDFDFASIFETIFFVVRFLIETCAVSYIFAVKCFQGVQHGKNLRGMEIIWM